MIISDEHRYLFVEQPHTGSSALRIELSEHYGGRPMLWLHATWADFLRVAKPEQKRYFVFSGIRNPLDEAVSTYYKYKTDHKQAYSQAIERQKLSQAQTRAFAIAHGEAADFDTYLRRVYRRLYDNDTLIYHKRMDQIIRFEHLQEDFSRTLTRLGLEQVRPLPLINKTGERGAYLDHYPPALRPHAARVFGPFMRKWGYPLPAEWVGITVPRSAIIEFRVRGVWRYLYKRYLRRPASPWARVVEALTRPIRRSAARLQGR